MSVPEGCDPDKAREGSQHARVLVICTFLAASALFWCPGVCGVAVCPLVSCRAPVHTCVFLLCAGTSTKYLPRGVPALGVRKFT